MCAALESGHIAGLALDRIGISGPQNTANYSNITGGFITERASKKSRSLAEIFLFLFRLIFLQARREED